MAELNLTINDNEVTLKAPLFYFVLFKNYTFQIFRNRQVAIDYAMQHKDGDSVTEYIYPNLPADIMKRFDYLLPKQTVILKAY
jgi:hypothetical protein